MTEGERLSLRDRQVRCAALLDGVPDERLAASDPATCMFLAYLRGDQTAALAFADEVIARGSTGRIRLRDGLEVGIDEPVSTRTLLEVSPPLAHQIILGLLDLKYGRSVDHPPSLFLSFAELAAETEESLLELYGVGSVRVRAFRAWLRGLGLRPADG